MSEETNTSTAENSVKEPAAPAVDAQKKVVKKPSIGKYNIRILESLNFSVTTGTVNMSAVYKHPHVCLLSVSVHLFWFVIAWYYLNTVRINRKTRFKNIKKTLPVCQVIGVHVTNVCQSHDCMSLLCEENVRERCLVTKWTPSFVWLLT